MVMPMPGMKRSFSYLYDNTSDEDEDEGCSESEETVGGQSGNYAPTKSGPYKVQPLQENCL